MGTKFQMSCCMLTERTLSSSFTWRKTLQTSFLKNVESNRKVVLSLAHHCGCFQFFDVIHLWNDSWSKLKYPVKITATQCNLPINSQGKLSIRAIMLSILTDIFLYILSKLDWQLPPKFHLQKKRKTKERLIKFAFYDRFNGR